MDGAPPDRPGESRTEPTPPARGRSRRSRPDPRSLAASVAFHVLAVALGLALTVAPARPVSFESIQIELVSPPGQAEREEPAAEELVVETPEPPVEETPPPVVEEREEPRPEPERAPARTEPTPAETEPEPEPRRGGAGERETADAGDDMNVRIEGLRRDYPTYYQNIIRQINRCFRPRPGERRRVGLRFAIHRDGTVSDLEIVRPSGSVEFDYRAMGAVECAGRPGRIGPLPQGYPFDVLAIEFEFDPSGRDG